MLIDNLKSDVVFYPMKLSRNNLSHTIIEADPATYPDRQNIKYLLEISKPEYLGSPNYINYPRIQRKEKPPYTSVGITIYEGATFTNIQNLFDSFLVRKAPFLGQKTMSVAWGMTSPFRIREIIEPGIKDVLLPTDYVIKAGISDSDYKSYGDNFLKTWAGKFMTWQPDEKIVSRNSPEYLYFLLNFSPIPSKVFLRSRLTKKDGSVEIKTLLDSGNIYTLPMYQVLCIPVGPELISITDEVVKYEVWLSNEQNERLSDVRTYIIDNHFQFQQRHVIFNNSFGAFDTLRFLGESVTNFKVQRTIVETDSQNFSELAELKVIDVRGYRTFTISTGFFKKKTAEHLKYLNELMLAEEIFEVTEKGFLPIILDTSDYVEHKDNPELTSLRLTFKYTNTERNYSSLPAVDTEIRPTAWRGYGEYSCELDNFFKRTGNAIFQRIELYYTDTNEAVRPKQIKLNLSDDKDYVKPFPFGTCTSPKYLSDEQKMVCTYQKSGCVEPYLGSYPEIKIPAGRWGSEVSKEEANARAIAEMNSLNTQTYANTTGVCAIGTYLNTKIQRLGSFTRNNCTGYLVGQAAEIIVPAARFSSNVSQADADAKAEAYFKTLDTQEYANTYGACVLKTYYSAAISRLSTYTRSNCGFGYIGEAPRIIIPFGQFTSNISQADADAKAEMYFLSLNTQAYADANGTCKLNFISGLWVTFWNYSNPNSVLPLNLDPFQTLKYSQKTSNVNFNFYNSGTFTEAKNAGFDQNQAGIRFEGYMDIKNAGDISFLINADQGLKLYINDVLLIDEFPKDMSDFAALSYSKDCTATVNLPIGKAKFKLEYYNLDGDSKVLARFKDSTMSSFTTIPDSYFSYIPS